MDFLQARAKEDEKKIIPYNVLTLTARQYNDLQRLHVDVLDNAGKVIAQKKFVWRGSIKNEILTAIIYNTCLSENVVIKPKHAANFIGLIKDGFHRGNKILQQLVTAGVFTFEDREPDVNNYLNHYTRNLQCVTQTHKDFIIELINLSETDNICMSSLMSSKVAGGIWAVIKCCKLPISIADMERATDTKKNTFINFYNAVIKNMNSFYPVFIKHNIPLDDLQ